MNQAAIDEFAKALIAARSGRRPMPARQADDLAATIGRDGALAVQLAVAHALGPVLGWKASPPTADAPGTMAPVLAGTLRPSGAVFGRHELFACGIELEIAFRIDDTLPLPEDPGFAAKVRAAVTPVAAIEIVDGRMADFTNRSPLAKLADNQINGGLVACNAIDANPNLQMPNVELAFGDATVLSGPQAVPGGDAFDTLLWLVRNVGHHLGGLAVGQVVTTGSLGGMRFVEFGTRVDGRIEGLGVVTMTFD